MSQNNLKIKYEKKNWDRHLMWKVTKSRNLIVGGDWGAPELTCDRDKETFRGYFFLIRNTKYSLFLVVRLGKKEDTLKPGAWFLFPT